MAAAVRSNDSTLMPPAIIAAEPMSAPSANSSKAVCLLSGGLDSATCLALARRDGFDCYALSFDYGQRHRVELEAARRVAEALGATAHRIAKIDLRVFGHSALTDDIAVPKGRDEAAMGEGFPSPTYPRATRFFCPSRSPGPKCSKPATSSSA